MQSNTPSLRVLMIESVRSNVPVVIGMVAKKREEEKTLAARNAHASALKLRDEALVTIRLLGYTRNGKIIPRKSEYRKELAQAMRAARVYAKLARPDYGYPKPPPDPAFPPINTQGISYQEAERNRLQKWITILQVRDSGDPRISHLKKHIEWLERKIRRQETTRKIMVNSRIVIVEKTR